jgi:PIN domain nuclease of toxin-antitoxin system
LDASAVLAYLQREPGWKFVDGIMDRSAVTAVNVIEVLTKLVSKGAPPEMARRTFTSLSLPVIALDESLARDTAELAHLAQSHGLSLGDRVCLTVARRLGACAVTTDQAWRLAGLGVTVRLLR